MSRPKDRIAPLQQVDQHYPTGRSSYALKKLRLMEAPKPEESLAATPLAASPTTHHRTASPIPEVDGYESFVTQCLEHAFKTNPLWVDGKDFQHFYTLLEQTLHSPEIAMAFGCRRTFPLEFPKLVKQRMLEIALNEVPSAHGDTTFGFAINRTHGARLKYTLSARVDHYAAECLGFLYADKPPDPAWVAIISQNPVRAFQMDCFDEARNSNLLGYHGYWQTNLMGLLEAAFNANATRAVLESADVTAKKFAVSVCDTLLEKALAADIGRAKNAPRVNHFMLNEYSNHTMALTPKVYGAVAQFSERYFKKKWPEVETKLALQDALGK